MIDLKNTRIELHHTNSQRALLAVSQRSGSATQRTPLKELAAAYGLKPSILYQASVVFLDGDEELHKKVMSDDIKITVAYRQLKEALAA